MESIRSETCVVCVHGAGRDRRAWLRHLPFLRRAGFGVLQFDCREHGNSDVRGRGLGYTTREHVDVQHAVAFARTSLGYARIVLLGTSQGASSSILAACCSTTPMMSSPNTATVDAVIAENPFATKRSLVYSVGSSVFGVCPTPLRPFRALLLKALWMSVEYRLYRGMGISAGEVPDPLDVIHRLPCPLLLMHGTRDEITPDTESQRLLNQASEPKSLWLAPGAEHTALYDFFPEEFERKILHFLEEHRL